MDYNKVGVNSGMIGLLFFSITVVLFLLAVFLESEAAAMYATIVNIFCTPIAALLAILFGALSIKKGNKKKTAFILGIVCLALLAVLQFGFSLVSFLVAK